jgi:hypothetical protein
MDKKERSSEKKFNKDRMIFGATDGSTESEGRYGFRKTASGRYVERDYPDADTELKQADAINKLMQNRKAASGRERLKTKGAVPVRSGSGKKLFEDFVKTARQHQKQQQQKQDIDNADMLNIYNASHHLSFAQWIWFVNDEYGGRI